MPRLVSARRALAVLGIAAFIGVSAPVVEPVVAAADPGVCVTVPFVVHVGVNCNDGRHDSGYSQANWGGGHRDGGNNCDRWCNDDRQPFEAKWCYVGDPICYYREGETITWFVAGRWCRQIFVLNPHRDGYHLWWGDTGQPNPQIDWVPK